MSALRQLAKPLAALPSHNLARLASTNASTAPPAGVTATTTGKSSSSAVTPLPDSKDVSVTAEVVSGAPTELRHRLVRIYQPTRNTMQSGGAKGEKWRIDWDVLLGAGRWQNPLMGWASSVLSWLRQRLSADYMQGTRVLFNTKEDAIGFAEKQGWDYYVQSATVKRIPPKNYSENFLYKPNKLRIMRHYISLYPSLVCTLRGNATGAGTQSLIAFVFLFVYAYCGNYLRKTANYTRSGSLLSIAIVI
ncbi:hypothetical protein K439DRAFT_1616306 [Ramaria rubella]|nr:hypothetical protein K439DRAFT_1616306 [Ramaria rubella]